MLVVVFCVCLTPDRQPYIIKPMLNNKTKTIIGNRWRPGGRVLFRNSVPFLMELVTHKSPPNTLRCYTGYIYSIYYEWDRHHWRHIVCTVNGSRPPDD